ncbi:GNAT family N-acetyltransferase [Nocardioides sp. HB32]
MTPDVRAAGPGDFALLDGLLRGLSRDSAYQRFQTGIGEPSPSLVRALLPPEGALLAFAGDEVVAHGLWVRASRAAEVALVVADAHQRTGIGTALAQALVDDAAARGITRIEAYSGAGNEAVARLVAHQAPNALRVLDGPSVTYTFATSTARSRSAYSRCSHSSVRIAPSTRVTG